MKLALFEAGQRIGIGVVAEDTIIDLKSGAASLLSGKSNDPYRIAEAYFPPDMKSFVDGGELVLKFAREVVSYVTDQLRGKSKFAGLKGENIIYRLSEVKLRAPVSKESRVIGAGGSFLSHTYNTSAWRKEKKITSLDEFAKKISSGEINLEPTNCNHIKPHPIVGHEGEIIIRPPFKNANGGVELSVVIGKGGREIGTNVAFDHVFGYTIHNDVTMREGDKCPFPKEKMYETFGPTGPWIVTKDEIPDPHNLRLSEVVNGTVLQEGSTSELAKYRDLLRGTIPEQVNLMSGVFSLQGGDIITTGSAGSIPEILDRPGRDWFKDGDVVESKVEKVGTLRNHVRILS